jgi:hypothetical protein
MSYQQVLSGLHTRFATVDGIKQIYDYEPLAIYEPPILYSLLDSFERVQSGQITSMRYKILHRLVFRWVDVTEAETAILPYVNSIPASVDADQTLGRVITSGIAHIDSCQAVFVTIGGVLFRCLDFYSNVLEKQPYQSGI